MARTNAQQKLGKKIKLLRTEINITQEKLSEMTGLDRTYISGIERGMRNPSLKNIEKLSRALKVKVSNLVEF